MATKNELARPKDIDEVIKYFSDCGICDKNTATKWYHENNAIGWMAGKYKIVDWRSAASVFILRLLEQNPNSISLDRPIKKQDIFQDEEMRNAMKRYEGNA